MLFLKFLLSILFQELSLHEDRIRAMCITDYGLVITGPGSRDGRIAVWKSNLAEYSAPKVVKVDTAPCEVDGFQMIRRTSSLSSTWNTPKLVLSNTLLVDNSKKMSLFLFHFLLFYEVKLLCRLDMDKLSACAGFFAAGSNFWWHSKTGGKQQLV